MRYKFLALTMIATMILTGCGRTESLEEGESALTMSQEPNIEYEETEAGEEESAEANVEADAEEIVVTSTETDAAESTEINTEMSIAGKYDGYVTPTELGNDIHSGIVELDGALYQFPIPVAVLQRDGFEFTNLEKQTVAGKDDNVEAILTRNGQIVISHLLISSPFETGEVPIEDCYVSYLNFIASDNPLARFPQFDTLPLSLTDVISVAEEAPYTVKKYGTKLYVFPLGDEKYGDIEIHGDDEAVNTRQIIYEYYYSSPVPYGGVMTEN